MAIAAYVRQLSLREKTGVFRLFLRGNLVKDGGDCFDPVQENHPHWGSQ
jgi:hypothetical protein